MTQTRQQKEILVTQLNPKGGPGDLEDTGTGDAAKRIGQAPTTTDVNDPERSSRNTAAGTGGGDTSVETAADDDSIDTSASIQPHNQGDV